MLRDAPTQARLTFNEPVSPLALKVVQPDGTAIDLRQIQTLPDGLQLSLPALSQQGAYALSWRVVSADGHPVGGTFTFAIGGKGASAPAHMESTPLGRDFLIWLSRVAWYAGLFIGIGLAVFPSRNAPSGETRRMRFRMLALGWIATPLCVGLLGVDALDMPLSGLLRIDAWRAAIATSFSYSAALALAALACATAVSRVDSIGFKRLLATAALGFVGATLAASGHASAAPPPWLARPAVWLHGVAVSLWIGSLLPLAYALGDAPDLAFLRRFSRFIPATLLVLFISGGVLIYVQFDTVSSLWRTSYGQVLSVKLVLLCVLLSLGAYNRYRLTRAVLRSDAGPRRAMRRIIYLECVLALAILAVVALWRFTPPPRAANVATAAAHVVSAHIHANAARADLTLAPILPGRSATLTLYLFNADLTPLIAQEVDVAFSNESARIEPIVLSAQRARDGAWRIENIELPRMNSWDVRIDALVSDFERVSLETTLELPE
jgi:copper transport protein